MRINIDSVTKHIEERRADCGEFRRTVVALILADIRHYCDRHKIAYHKADREGHMMYSQELVGLRKRA